MCSLLPQVLISRNYRGDIDLGVIEKFMPLLMEKEEEGLLTPILQTTECTFAHIKHNNLYIVSTTKKNANIALVFVFLHKVVQVNIAANVAGMIYNLRNLLFLETEVCCHLILLV
jgi:hypothetical protein